MLTMEEAMKQTGALPFAAGNIVKGSIIEVRPKEVLVDIGYKSEGVISANEFEDIKNVKVGDEIDVLIEKLEDKEGMVVLSKEKAEFKKNWERILTICNEGGTIAGKVKGIVKGGLLGKIGHPSELLKVGQDIDVVVLDINREKERVSLGLKQKLANPWDNIEQKYPVGAKVKGRVVNLVPYGAFVELEPGVEGLVHVTELSWTKRIAKPSDVLKQGQDIEAVVLGINRDEQKISLGLRQLEANPWDRALEKYPPGTRLKGKIRNLTSYGAFIELEEGLDGMIHVSDISWTRKINHPSEVLKKGDEVEAVVLEIDKSNQRISVGIKQLSEDPWTNIDKFYKVGDLVTGKVTKLASFGAFVGLQHDIDGLVHISQVSEERVDKIKNVLKVGQDVTARVIKIDKGDRRIGLSIKAANYSAEQLKAEQAVLDSLKPGEDLVALQHAFDAADEARQEKPD